MAKTNFTRVEGALEEGLQRMTQARLLGYSDIAAQVGPDADSMQQKRQQAVEVTLRQQQERRLLAAAMQFDINQLFKKDHHLYTALGTYHEEIEALIKGAATLTAEEWQRLQMIKETLDGYKKEKCPFVADDTIIAQQRLKHINKSFNTNDNWLPLRPPKP